MTEWLSICREAVEDVRGVLAELPRRSDREQLLATLDEGRALTNVRVHLKRKDGSDVTGIVNVSLIPAEEGEMHLLGTLVEE